MLYLWTSGLWQQTCPELPREWMPIELAPTWDSNSNQREQGMVEKDIKSAYKNNNNNKKIFLKSAYSWIGKENFPWHVDSLWLYGL